jgi:predicted P-loop ATPase
MTTNSQATFSLNQTGAQPVVPLILAQALAQAYPGILRLNRFTGDIMVTGEGDWKPGVRVSRRCDDAELLDIMMFAQGCGYLKATAEKVYDAVRYLAQNDPFDPAVDWLLGLPEWDRLERLPRFAELYLGNPVGSHPRTFVIWFLQLIHRILAPGPQCKADLVPILWGRQGLYKSTLGLALCNDPDWFSGELGEDLTHKDTRLHLRGKLIIELTEMRQFNAARSDTTKQFLSTTVDRYRPPYGRLDIEQPRRCVFYASTNRLDMLQDETGNRRFVPVEVMSKIPIEQVILDRAQLFAEALHLYNQAKGGAQGWWLTDDEQDKLETTRREHLVRTTYDDSIDDFMKEECKDGSAVYNHLFPFRLVMSYVLGDGESRSVHDRESRKVQQCLTRAGCRSYVVRQGPTVHRFWGRNGGATNLLEPIDVTQMSESFLRRMRL